MKTTVDIPEALLTEAKELSSRERTTLRSLIIEGLLLAIERRQSREFRLRRAAFRGQGPQPGIDLRSWEQVRSMIYQGHGE